MTPELELQGQLTPAELLRTLAPGFAAEYRLDWNPDAPKTMVEAAGDMTPPLLLIPLSPYSRPRLETDVLSVAGAAKVREAEDELDRRYLS